MLLLVLLALDPAAIMAEADRLAAQPLWPGFDARKVAVALYDGQRTHFFRHPSPPQDFTPPRANTSVELGGILTATVLLDAHKSPRELAAIVIHEAFHVFQRKRHAVWSANEADLFTYPTENPEALALRRLESLALSRALRDPCWTSAALALRRERFQKLPAESAAYERKSELNEGLAQYVERLAARRKIEWPVDEFPADAVRVRSYLSGQTLAVLLDRLRPGWKRELESGDSRSLDELLSATPKPSGCEPSADERADAIEKAKADVDALSAGRERRRREVESRPGPRVVVHAEAQPLFPQGFDPLNVERLGGTRVLHTRWLKLGNDAGTIEILDRDALTEGAGGHPLFQGIANLVVTGLAAAPKVSQAGGVVTIEAPGVKLELRGARVEKSRDAVTVRLSPKRP